MFCQVLRVMKGFDEFNTILLPPRQPAEKLPQELLDYYEGLFNIPHPQSFILAETCLLFLLHFCA